jgi:hypothetical protein
VADLPFEVRAVALEGRRVHQITKIPFSDGGGLLEDTFHVTRLLKWLPAGPTANDGFRKDDLIQFVAREGGIRTIKVHDLTVL